MPDGFSNNNPQKSQKNVLGGVLQTCSMDPVTGFYRNGCCETDYNDYGLHTVCSKMTFEFLEYSKSVGNDLSTPAPQWGFPGLKHGDKWCLCATRWKQALENNVAPKVILEATNEKSLEIVSIDKLINYAHKTV